MGLYKIEIQGATWTELKILKSRNPRSNEYPISPEELYSIQKLFEKKKYK